MYLREEDEFSLVFYLTHIYSPLCFHISTKWITPKLLDSELIPQGHPKFSPEYVIKNQTKLIDQKIMSHADASHVIR